MAGSRTLKLSILADVDDLKKKLDIGSKEVDTFGDKMTKAGKVVGAALAAAAAAAGAMAIKIGVDAVKAASDLSETISKVGVLFGDTSKDIEKFASSAAASLGQTKQQALDAAATFATFGKAAGLTGKDLSKFSIDFVKLSSDLASFNNTSPEQAINAIGSALRGESEPLRAYGVLLNDATLKSAALELGIINTTKNALTPQQKVLAAQKVIFEQTTAAQGDFARTSGGLANQTRILTAQLENAKTTIGQALLPIVLELATFFSKNVIPLVEKLSTAFSEKQGNLGFYIQNVGNTLKRIFLPIWEGLVYLFREVREAISSNGEAFLKFGKLIADYVAPVIGTVLGGALKVVGEIAGGVLTIIGKVAGFITDVVETAIKGVNLLIQAYNKIPLLPNIPTINTGSVPQVTVPKVSGTGGSSSVPSMSIPSIQTPSSSGASKAASSAAAATASASGTLVPTVTLGGAPAGYVTNNINIGVAGDPEGVARTVVDVINQSYYRGGLGAQAYKL